MGDWFIRLFTSGAFIILAIYLSVPFFHLIRMSGEKSQLRRRLAAGKLNPRGFQMRMELGDIYARSRRWRQAESELREAVEIHEDHAHCQSLLGFVLFRQGKFEEAIKHFETALDLRPSEGYGRTQVLLARSYEGLENDRKAAEWYGAALERNLSICEPAYRLGLLNKNRDRKQEAQKNFEEAVRRFSPTDKRNYWKNLWFSTMAKFQLLTV